MRVVWQLPSRVGRASALFCRRGSEGPPAARSAPQLLLGAASPGLRSWAPLRAYSFSFCCCPLSAPLCSRWRGSLRSAAFRFPPIRSASLRRAPKRPASLSSFDFAPRRPVSPRCACHPPLRCGSVRLPRVPVRVASPRFAALRLASSRFAPMRLASSRFARFGSRRLASSRSVSLGPLRAVSLRSVFASPSSVSLRAAARFVPL